MEIEEALTCRMAIQNRSAYHDYFIEDKYDAGIVLAGTEVKSIREGKASFVDSFCLFHNGELWLRNMNIAEYRFGTTNNHLAVHDRKLLLNKKELRKLEAKTKERGYSIIPLKLFFNDKGFVKVEIGLARGKKLHDKRDTLRQKDAEREMKRFLK